MIKKEVHFLGVLANVDQSILKYRLEHGFEITSVPVDEAVHFISNLENLPRELVYDKLFFPYPCINSSEKRIYFISKKMIGEIKLDYRGRVIEIPKEVWNFAGKHVHEYLRQTLRLMRLFKEGNIFMPLSYYYYEEGGIPKSFMRTSTSLPLSRELYHLEDSEIPKLHKFLKEFTLPFQKDFLRLAFENFEESYHVTKRYLAFLSLMIGLEALFNPGGGETRYRVSRNVAVLLGRNREDSKAIFENVKKLYDKRSKVIHSGKVDEIEEVDVLNLRNYLRESIKKIYRMGIEKDELLEKLNESGYGECL
ncbi:hypothetical protein DRH29_05765 [candidate division Kazan bacterium]|uniref:Uncharacterized protein n=1 Tax=candidate division Kazan bacterium TaxID=2202143 RepID=A0A420ZAX5_UNCK3|nr:MAG: hypothetical protein DRH29_05765 [candidate division Kazan bacterium]